MVYSTPLFQYYVISKMQAILSGFRSGRFLVLVATNVVARGLDIHNVQLIIQVCIFIFIM